MTTAARAEAVPRKGLIERALAPVADVRRGEALSALLMALTMFFILYAYYLLKTAREVFILAEGGAEVKSYSSAGQALLLLGLVPAYGKLASTVNRMQLIQWASFKAIRVLKIADNSLDDSLDNTTRQALWLPTSREAKYKAKQAVDSFCQRAGDVLQAGIVYLSTLGGFGATAFAALNFVFVGGWLAVGVGLNRRLRAQAEQAGRDQL